MRRTRTLAIAPATLALLLALAPRPASAQPAPPPPARPQPGAAPAPAAAAPQPDAPTAPAGPRAIEVNDPALTPVAPPAHTLTSWQEALKIMSRRSTDLTIAIQEVARAEGLAEQALGQALPQIDAQGTIDSSLASYQARPSGSRDFYVGDPADPANRPVYGLPLGRYKADGPTPPRFVASITARQPTLAPRIWYGIGTARLATEAAKLSVDDRRRTVLAAVASSVVAVVTAERVAEINRVGLRSSLERLELTRRRQQLGTGTKLDVVRAEQDVALARAQLVSGDEALRQAREALGLALGTTDAYSVTPSISLNAIEQELRSTCAPGEVDKRADVLAAQTELRVAERNVRDAELAYMPYAEVSTTLSATRDLDSATSFGNGFEWSIRGVLTIPIWDGSRAGAVKAAKASAEQQRARVDATGRAASLETTQAVRSVQVAEQSRVVSAQARDLAKETARLTQVAYEAGTATSFELVDAAQRQRQTELDLAVREFDLVRAKISALLASANCRY